MNIQTIIAYDAVTHEEREVHTVDTKGYIKENFPMLDVSPMIFFDNLDFYVSEALFFMVNGCLAPYKAVILLKSGVELYTYNYMNMMAEKRNQFTGMPITVYETLECYKKLMNELNGNKELLQV